MLYSLKKNFKVEKSLLNAAHEQKLVHKASLTSFAFRPKNHLSIDFSGIKKP